MKKILLSIIALACISSNSMAGNEKDVDSKLDKVTVYLNGAQSTRKAKVTLKKGINVLYFNDVSPYINEKTIQVEGLGDYIILDTKKNRKYPEPAKITTVPNKVFAEIKDKKDSVREINFELQNISRKLSYLNTERSYLLKNKVFTKDTLPVLQQSLAYLRKQLFEINELEQKLKREQSNLSILRSEVNARITVLNNYSRNNRQVTNNKPINQIIVTVQAKRELSGTMQVTYFVANASWSPSYDIRVKDIKSPVDLTMKATVYQNTGEDWDNVKLTLSTNNPYKNKIKPELNTWYINYYNPNMGYYKDAENKAKKAKVANRNAVTLSEVSVSTDKVESTNSDFAYSGSRAPLPSAVRSTNYTVKNQMMANVEYRIDLRYSIKADNKAHLVAVNQQSIKAKYNHYLVPKYDKESYLVAQLLDWEELDLLPSKANLFYEGSYIGETRINPTANDTLYISLGNDRNVRIKRTKDKEKSKDKVFSNRKSTTISYDLIVKNMGVTELNIIVEDHIPVSKDKTIVVTLESKSKAKFNEKTGMLVWEFDLRGKQTKKLNYTYKVEYDNDKPMDLSRL